MSRSPSCPHMKTDGLEGWEHWIFSHFNWIKLKESSANPGFSLPSSPSPSPLPVSPLSHIAHVNINFVISVVDPESMKIFVSMPLTINEVKCARCSKYNF